MEIFSHINELRVRGWERLRTLVLASEKVVLWAPAISLLDDLRQKDPLLPTGQELLWYVRNGHVRILARDWWIENGPKRQKHQWKPARKWMEDFDGAIFDIWKEDQRAGRTGLTARVVSLPDGTGVEWAEELVRKGEVDHESLLDMVKTNSALVPPAYLDRLRKAPSARQAAVILLGSARNHSEAFQLSGADRDLGSVADAGILRIVGEGLVLSNARPRSIVEAPGDPEKLTLALQGVIHRLSQATKPLQSQEEAFSRVQLLLGNRVELQNLREWVLTADLMAATYRQEFFEEELAESLAKAVENGVKRKALWDYLAPQSPLQRIAAVGGLVVMTVALKIGSPLAPISLSIFALRPVEGLLQQIGLISETYTGPRWPLWVAGEGNRVLRRRKEAIIRSLRS